MTIKDLIQFLENSASNCKDGVDTNLKAISTQNCFGGSVVFTDRLLVTMDKHSSINSDPEYVDLIFEEK